MPNNYLRINKERWCPVLESFLLSLSDQQLLTGLAVLIAGFGRWNRIQVYHWELVTDLAFVSSNTHIATLAVLRKYFREPKHKWIRAWRATAMVLLGIVLFVANAYSGYRYWYNYIAWPMRCVALDIRQHSNDSFGGEPAAYMAVWSAFLLVNYPIAILGLFKGVCDKTRSFINDLSTNVDSHIRRSKAVLHSDEHCNRRHIYWAMVGTYAQVLLFYVVRLLLLVLHAVHSTPFFIVEDTAWYIFNMVTLLQYRSENSPWLDDPSKEDDPDGFGQILPIIMLLLPVMAFTEQYVDSR